MPDQVKVSCEIIIRERNMWLWRVTGVDLFENVLVYLHEDKDMQARAVYSLLSSGS